VRVGLGVREGLGVFVTLAVLVGRGVHVAWADVSSSLLRLAMMPMRAHKKKTPAMPMRSFFLLMMRLPLSCLFAPDSSTLKEIRQPTDTTVYRTGPPVSTGSISICRRAAELTLPGRVQSIVSPNKFVNPRISNLIRVRPRPFP